jgi:hypothetical protein
MPRQTRKFSTPIGTDLVTQLKAKVTETTKLPVSLQVGEDKEIRDFLLTSSALHQGGQTVFQASSPTGREFELVYPPHMAGPGQLPIYAMV